MSHPTIQISSKFIIKFSWSLVGHQFYSILASREATSPVGVVELLPDDDADAGSEHEEQEEDDESEDRNCGALGCEAIDW